MPGPNGSRRAGGGDHLPLRRRQPSGLLSQVPVERKGRLPRACEGFAESPEYYQKEIVRNEMFTHLDYYVTESSGHNSEYNQWFRKRPDLIEKYCTQHTTGTPASTPSL
ncbi:MAG: hypothetical protein ACLR23_27435 [Clostridia bacterium]